MGLLSNPSQLTYDVVRYNFDIVRTLKGRQRRHLELSRLKFPNDTGGYSFWFLRPPPAEQDREDFSQALAACAAASRPCEANDVRARYNRALVYTFSRENCSVQFGFRTGKLAMLYWRGNVLAAVAEVTPEAAVALAGPTR